MNGSPPTGGSSRPVVTVQRSSGAAGARAGAARGRQRSSTFTIVAGLTIVSTCIAFYDLLLLATHLT